MPKGSTHTGIGAVVAIIVFWIVQKTQWVSTELTHWEWAVVALIVYLYSQLPDIDADVSVVNKIWNTVAGLLGIYVLMKPDVDYKLKIVGAIAVGSIVALEYVKHRGVTHTVIFSAIMSAPLWLLNPLYAIIGFTAALSHIIADGDLGR